MDSLSRGEDPALDYRTYFEHHFTAVEGEPFQETLSGVADFLASVLAPGGTAMTRVVDVGCGAGQLAIELATRGATVVGIDEAPSLVATARRLAARADRTVDFLCGRGQDLLPTLEPADMVLLWGGILGYASESADRDLVESAVRACRSGGVVVVSLFNPLSLTQGGTPNCTFDGHRLHVTIAADAPGGMESLSLKVRAPGVVRRWIQQTAAEDSQEYLWNGRSGFVARAEGAPPVWPYIVLVSQVCHRTASPDMHDSR